MTPVRISSVNPTTTAEGPGVRFAIWFQGCTIRCPGCCNPHLLAQAGGKPVSADTLVAEISAVRPHVEGVSLLGGEPFDQAAGAANVAMAAVGMGLSVVTFTGYCLTDLVATADCATHQLLAHTDILVDGPFEPDNPDNERRWVGSRNQQFHYLTDRYAPGMERCSGQGVKRTIEVRIDPCGQLSVTGWPDWA